MRCANFCGFFFYVFYGCKHMKGVSYVSGWCARGRSHPKRVQNEYVFHKKTRFMAARQRGGVRAWGAAIGRRVDVCVRAPARPLAIPTARQRAATHAHMRARSTTCARYLYCHIYFQNYIFLGYDKYLQKRLLISSCLNKTFIFIKNILPNFSLVIIFWYP